MNSSMIRNGMKRGSALVPSSASAYAPSSLLSHLPFHVQQANFSKKDESPIDKKGSKKENFAKKFLEPAARGELTKHQSGIPKLAARKPKGHTVKDAFPGKESEQMLADSVNSGKGSDKRLGGGFDRGRRKGSGGGRQNNNNNSRNAPSPAQQKARSAEMKLAALFEGVKPEDLNPAELHKNIQWLGKKKSMQQSQFRQQRNVKQRQGGRDRPQLDMWGDPEIQAEIDDPWETDSMFFKYENPHIESKREAKPIASPTNRVNPPKEFVDAYKAFAYVTNVPRPVIGGALGSYENPLHRHEVTELVANALSVPATNVFCATMNSAFVGFEDSKEAAEVLAKSDSKRIITGEKVKAEIYQSTDGISDEETKFVSSSDAKECIVKIDHIPGGMRPGTIARLLHSAIKLDTNNICISSPTTALIRFSSADNAKSFVNNSGIQGTVASLQRQILRVHPAKRELVHHKYSGPIRKIQLKKMTDKLVVAGDQPSKDFLLCHGGLLHLDNVPISLSKQAISEHFQKFCVELRDVEGSIEIVKSVDGHRTGRVYVGFDYEQEAVEAWKEIKASGQKMMLNEAGPAARVRPVKEVAFARGSKLGARSERTQEELIASFSSWKNDIDPKDMEILESFGVTIDVLEETFSAARRNNPTFGVEDQARKGERLRDEFGPGEHFKEFVQMYIDTLKELAATKDDPGLKYKAMFLPEEDMEYDLFDKEEKRLAALRSKSSE